MLRLWVKFHLNYLTKGGFSLSSDDDAQAEEDSRINPSASHCVFPQDGDFDRKTKGKKRKKEREKLNARVGIW